jgi:acyl carrier protein
MTENQILDTVFTVLKDVAPEADPNSIDPDENLQDELDIDSIDYLNFMMGLHEKTGVDVPERDYAKLATVNSAVSYLAARVG